MNAFRKFLSAGRSLRKISAQLIGLAMAAPCWSAVSDTAISDVSSRAFSVVWASNVEIASAEHVGVRIFEDLNSDGIPDGPNIAPQLTTSVASNPVALNNGIVKVDVRGVQPSSTYLVETLTTTAEGAETFPPPEQPSLRVTTADRLTKINGTAVIANSLVLGEASAVGGTEGAPATTLVLASIPGVSAYPISAFNNTEAASGIGLLDLNNVIDAATNSSAQIGDNAVVVLSLYRGLVCAGDKTNTVKHHRRLDGTAASPRVTTVVLPARCYAQDLNCDDIIDLADAQMLFDAYLSEAQNCGFNSDFDLNGDQIVDVLDAQQIFDRYLYEAPFE